MTNSYVQVPPDSTGKKLAALQHTIDATVVQVPVYHLADPQTPSQVQHVDAQGQASVRFAEGSPSMDAFGALRVSNAVMIGAYEYTSDPMNDLFTDHTGTGGSIEHRREASELVLITNTQSGSHADRTSNRYHFYQPGVGQLILLTLAHSDAGKANNERIWGYGNQMNGLFFKLTGTALSVAVHTTTRSTTIVRAATGTTGGSTLTVSDASSITTGMFVLGEGVTFESKVSAINGLTITLDHPLYADVTLAGFVNVDVVDFPQASWSNDKLDGTGISGFDLDIVNANLYWIDLAWLGVGAVRFGVVSGDGSRVVCHTVSNPNANIGAYMQSGSRPIHFSNKNTGATSGSSELKLICSAVYSEAKPDYTYWRFDDIEQLTPVTVTTNTHILSAKPKVALANQTPNRIGAYPECLQVFVTGGTIKLSIVDDAVLSAPTWGIAGEGSMSGDISASTLTGGSSFKSFYLGAGAHNINLNAFYEFNDEGYHTLADLTDSYTFSLVATKLEGTTVTVVAGMSYKELR